MITRFQCRSKLGGSRQCKGNAKDVSRATYQAHHPVGDDGEEKVGQEGAWEVDKHLGPKVGPHLIGSSERGQDWRRLKKIWRRPEKTQEDWQSQGTGAPHQRSKSMTYLDERSFWTIAFSTTKVCSVRVVLKCEQSNQPSGKTKMMLNTPAHSLISNTCRYNNNHSPTVKHYTGHQTQC